MTAQVQLQSLLRELFQLDNSDLDFGIYRILNLKHKEVEEFINVVLPKRIEEVREKILARQSVDLKAEIEMLKKELASNFQINFEQSGDLETKAKKYEQLPLFKEPYNKYIEAKKKIDALHVSEDTERSIYNELYRFFDRYYEGGDFISKPRAGSNNYMIPYNGEEVKLYWANYDQYYIKTAENFKNYIFTNNSKIADTLKTVEFKIVDAETTVNNNKEEKGRLFIPTEEPIEWNGEERKLTVKFYYKIPSADEKTRWGEKQSVKKEDKGINQRLYASLEKFIAKNKDAELLRLSQKTRKNSKGDEQPLFLYHLNRYTSINSFDYFIHKDLRGFLRRELDYFLKNEVLSVSFLNPEWQEGEVQEAIKLNVLKASAIRDLALTIIDFLGELENFQKRLFEKKKFVVQSDYCLTLDVITDEALRNEILDDVLGDKEQKQVKEWIALGFIADKKDLKDLKKLLKNGDTRLKYLVLDTQFLPEKLRWKLLASIDDLDNKTTGLLINSENWQALSFLLPKFMERVQSTYIDPPYNTDASAIVYKNNYKDSSWLALLENRLNLAKVLLDKEGIICVAIDDEEASALRFLLSKLFTKEVGIAVVRSNPAGRKTKGTFAPTHEYAMFYGKSVESTPMNLDVTEKRLARYPLKDEKGNFAWANLIRSGSGDKRSDRPTLFYPIFVTSNGKIRIPEMRWDEESTSYVLLEKPKKGEDVVYPVLKQSSSAIEKRWHRGHERIATELEEYRVRRSSSGEISIDFKTRMDEESLPTTWWDNKEYASANYGAAELKDLFGEKSFDFAKARRLVEDCILASGGRVPSSLTLDFFGGSGTTAHAVINLNRDDGGNRKYILVEVAKFFDTVTKPRVQKVIFSDKWKDGKPEANGKGISQIFQYLKLEQYEDTLNNIEFASDAEQLPMVDRLRYLLTYGTQGSDSLLNVEKFTNPFSYTMKIVKLNEVDPEQTIDLVTTFNFFLGIDVRRCIIEQHYNREYRIVLGKKRQQEYIVVWRAYEEGKLDLTKERDWIEKQQWFTRDALLYCNADNAFGARSIEAEFKRIMNEPVQ